MDCKDYQNVRLFGTKNLEIDDKTSSERFAFRQDVHSQIVCSQFAYTAISMTDAKPT